MCSDVALSVSCCSVSTSHTTMGGVVPWEGLAWAAWDGRVKRGRLLAGGWRAVVGSAGGRLECVR